MAEPQRQHKPPKTHITMDIIRGVDRGQATVHLISPTGRTLVLTAADLATSLYTFEALVGRAGRITLPRLTVAALTSLGTVVEAAAPSTPKEETPDA